MNKSSKTQRFKRKPIPTSLHSELTEYSSLLRALRTNDVLDVAGQITRHFELRKEKGKEPVGKAQAYDSQDEESDGEFEEELASDPGPSRKRKRSSSPASTENSNSRELWTRWPLLARDVPAPEWSLEDEVTHITKSLLGDFSDSEHDSDSDSEIDTQASALSLSTTLYLDNLLESLAATIPKRSPSMANRLAPAGWREVLTAARAQVEASGHNSTKITERVQERLENLYDKDATPRTILASPRKNNASPAPAEFRSSHASHNLIALHRSSQTLSTAFASHGASSSDLTSLDFGYPGEGYALPEGWVDEWRSNYARDKKKEKTKEKKKQKRTVDAWNHAWNHNLSNDADEQAESMLPEKGVKKKKSWKEKVVPVPVGDEDGDAGRMTRDVEAALGGEGEGVDKAVVSPRKKKKKSKETDKSKIGKVRKSKKTKTRNGPAADTAIEKKGEEIPECRIC
ncbi:hypothetical protein BDP27DRAFT_1412486 [Rhodocollybia butyracea]|uniref:Rrn9 domain-containing protein n=1 Tax=Rhodocollybia butyracea TaxID=206335 RepID=A0A9P5QBQ3_9AGAR|nr:hypothetical protein BDP27DRAFT_1412486 [Rhodocollybia butyracea]